MSVDERLSSKQGEGQTCVVEAASSCLHVVETPAGYGQTGSEGVGKICHYLQEIRFLPQGIHRLYAHFLFIPMSIFRRMFLSRSSRADGVAGGVQSLYSPHKLARLRPRSTFALRN